ncbi:hypothetical protein PTKIN_Ptkin03bG0060600 [Pterospermum kingtungense]
MGLLLCWAISIHGLLWCRNCLHSSRRTIYEAIIATTYGNGIIPEIQATIAPPVKGKMFKGFCVCYTVVIITFFTVAISGYWAFGNQCEGLVLFNFLANGKPLAPNWFILMTNLFTILQLSAVAVVKIYIYAFFTMHILYGLFDSIICMLFL